MTDWLKNPPTTLDEAISLAKRLRVAADESEARLMRFLRWLESSEMWRESADATFDAFLKSAGICEPNRYRDAVEALEAFGDETVSAIGLQGAVIATRVPESKRPEAVAKLAAIRDVNGVPASRKNAETVLANAHLLPPVVQSKAERKLSRVAELESANRELRAQLAAALKRAEEAEARAEKYAEQLRALGAAPKAATKRKRAA